MNRVPTSARGELSRWMIELQPGVFLGTLSKMVREKLWEKVCHSLGGTGGCILINAFNNEQHFQVKVAGDTKRELVDFDGLTLVRIPAGEKLGNSILQTAWTNSSEVSAPREPRRRKPLPLIPESPPLEPSPDELSPLLPPLPSSVPETPPEPPLADDSISLENSPLVPPHLRDIAGELLRVAPALVRQFAPPQAYEKGDAYQSEGRVHGVRVSVILGTATLHGKVAGNELYDTEVGMSGGQLHGQCSCPVRQNCKHCVALVLEWLRAPSNFVVG